MKRSPLIMDNAERILSSRTELCWQMPVPNANNEEEGGCGVTGFICSIPVTGKNIFAPSLQMHNRGNGKGGGIGAVGFIPRPSAFPDRCWTRTICYMSRSWIPPWRLNWRTLHQAVFQDRQVGEAGYAR